LERDTHLELVQVVANLPHARGRRLLLAPGDRHDDLHGEVDLPRLRGLVESSVTSLWSEAKAGLAAHAGKGRRVPGSPAERVGNPVKIRQREVSAFGGLLAGFCD
jgi:hypothetical protein